MVSHSSQSSKAWQQADPDASSPQPRDTRHQQQQQQQQQQAQQPIQHTMTTTASALSYTPIQPRGNPDEHRQAMVEEKEIYQNQVLSERRRRNTQAAARMRERQRERERGLMQRRDNLMARMTQLETELSAIQTQRQQAEADTSSENYEIILDQLSSELEAANAAMHQIIDEVEKLVDIVKSIGI
ncbi:hypothetical protein GGI26_002710 [Coemansia sp. RSA 1358]|nr:hypothetical protein GGI26_002710 [Coemansia sp. RSA 1358]